MSLYISTGNAAVDGAGFQQWLVGDLEKWRLENGAAFDPERMGLRSTGRLEVKFGLHPKGQQRPGGWAGASDKTSLSLLARGSFVIVFRSPENPSQEEIHKLQNEGDYVIWREVVEHTWRAEEDSLILTVRWRE
jgi:hypothetical protein